MKKDYQQGDESEITPIEVDCDKATAYANANRWRLSDADNSIARYVGRVFDNIDQIEDPACLEKLTDDKGAKPSAKAKASAFLEKLTEQYMCGQPSFSMVFENTDNFDRDILGNYWYVLRDRQQQYWRSPCLTPFGSASEALTAFDVQHVSLLMLARDIQHYRIRSRKVQGQTVFFIELLDSDGKPIAESVETATDTEGVNNLMGTLQKHALAYPIVKHADNSFSFQLFDARKQAVSWLSCHRFKKQEEAKARFSSFLDVLKYRYNYHLVASDDGCRLTIELIEVLLDQVTTQRYKATDKEDTSDCDWLSVEYFIDDLLEAGEAAFVPTVDYLNCCGYGFNLAQKDYRVARHPSAFHTLTAREQRRDALWHDARCRARNESSLQEVAKNEAKQEGSAIQLLIDAIEKAKFEKSEKFCLFEEKKNIIIVIKKEGKDVKEEKEFTIKHKQKIYLWQYINNKATKPFNSNSICVWDNITALDSDGKKQNYLVNIPELTDGDEKQAEQEANDFILSSLEARKTALKEAIHAMPNEHSWLVLTDADGKLQLGITRADGSLILVFEEWTAETANEMKLEIARLYESINFDSEVIALPDGTYGFEIREKTTEITGTYINGLVDENCDSIPIELPVFKVVWRNIKTYKSAEAAKEAVKAVKVLLYDKANYARTNAADGSPTLEIVDPSAIIAQHPRTYTTSRERDAAWQRVRQHIHTEGMHLVEHLLLRPHYDEDTLTNDEAKAILDPFESKNLSDEAKAILEPLESKNLNDKEKVRLLLKVINKRLLPPYLLKIEGQKATETQSQIDPEPETEIKNFDPSDDDDVFDDYIMGADPYSFWLTVVLPHWSERFRDLDFRDFFEGTLRREAPAHVGLNILWVNPQQMKQFEKVWRSWLEVAKDPTHNLYTCRKQCLLDVFKNLKSVTPEAGLFDCAAGVTGKLILLDKTTLR